MKLLLPTAWLFCLLAVIPSARAENPLWQFGAVLPPDGSDSSLEELAQDAPLDDSGGGVAMAALSVPEGMQAEIQSLGTALGDAQALPGEPATAKAVRVFNWVRNTIDYDCYFGLRKGAALTLLEGSGNDFDQSVLLAELLKAAGYPAGEVILRFRRHRIAYTHLAPWLGLRPSPENKSEEAKWHLTNHGYPSNGVAQQSGDRVAFDRLWVELTVDGVVYRLDPAYKEYAGIAGFDLATSTGYSRSSILSTAGGETGTNYVRNVSEANIASYLNERTRALVASLDALPTPLLAREAAGGRRMVKQEITTLADAFPLPVDFLSTVDRQFSGAADPTMADLKSTVRFLSSPLDFTIPTADLAGRKITLTFVAGSGLTAELRLDDGPAVASRAVTSGGSMNLRITVTHPKRARWDSPKPVVIAVTRTLLTRSSTDLTPPRA
ncbi:MAG: transglutaminase domain-containing protein [Rhodospirillales bacterium]|nr:transglutaminase domain-containing protein [Rhodospirillales bacterium]